VGKAALEGRPGVLSVGRGWLGWSEVNPVVYQPEKTSVERMEEWLREAGTYIRTVQDPVRKNGKGGNR
jgi:hypothetical protein